jgi:hypothetical protein
VDLQPLTSTTSWDANSAGGNDVAAIARLVQTSPDRVREMIHRFDDLGM